MANSVFPIPFRNRLAASVLIGGGFTLAGGMVVGEFIHGLGTPLSLAAFAGAAAWLLQRSKKPTVGRLPEGVDGMQKHCQKLIEQFEALGFATGPMQSRLDQICCLAQRPDRHVVLAGAEATVEQSNQVLAAFSGSSALQLHLAQPLPRESVEWNWPESLLQADHLVYVLSGAPTVADLRWLEALPQAMPTLLLAEGELDCLRQWSCELGDRWPLLSCDGPLKADLLPLAQQKRLTQLRCLRQLNQEWQVLLEVERRKRLQPLLQRSQWLVATAVFASPLPSADLLLLAVVNGLLLKEMAALWRCEWTADQLQTAALELARTAMGLGALEWGSQAVAGLLKLHGVSWLVGGAMQALAAAYFTRVVARSMADYLALSLGVPEAELGNLKLEMPLLVAKAVAQEKLDWPQFGQQARQWLKQQVHQMAIGPQVNPT